MFIVNCICGSVHLKSNHSRHLQSQKHVKFMHPNDVQIKQTQNNCFILRYENNQNLCFLRHNKINCMLAMLA